jgi:hypothetical protein
MTDTPQSSGSTQKTSYMEQEALRVAVAAHRAIVQAGAEPTVNVYAVTKLLAALIVATIEPKHYDDFMGELDPALRRMVTHGSAALENLNASRPN